jgi:hypothetical protein
MVEVAKVRSAFVFEVEISDEMLVSTVGTTSINERYWTQKLERVPLIFHCVVIVSKSA